MVAAHSPARYALAIAALTGQGLIVLLRNGNAKGVLSYLGTEADGTTVRRATRSPESVGWWSHKEDLWGHKNVFVT